MSKRAECDACGQPGYHTARVSTVRGPERPLCQDCLSWGQTTTEAGYNLLAELAAVTRRAEHVQRLNKKAAVKQLRQRGFETEEPG